MIELKGKYSTAKVFTDNVEETATSQIINLLNQPFVENAKVRIMPDVHAGTGCVIGFTADLGDKVIPNLVGVDIGCGMECVSLGNRRINMKRLDEVIHNNIPSGHEVHSEIKTKMSSIQDLVCFSYLKDIGRVERSIGTLGSGNHFIELDKDSEGFYYLVIHSGSRNLGKQVADHYQKLAVDSCKGLGDLNVLKIELINRLKVSGDRKLIQKELSLLEKKFRNAKPSYPNDLCFLDGKLRNDYLHDMKICQDYAVLNRETMANIILKEMFNDYLDNLQSFCTIHNYIDFNNNIIRKGAVSAGDGEQLIIPINMRDGSVLATGKGNPDWNYSAPHGAGRLMGRNEAKRRLLMTEYTDTMKDVYTTTVSQSTLDESPMAYKPIQEILDNITDTATVNRVIKSVYNFKSAD